MSLLQILLTFSCGAELALFLYEPTTIKAVCLSIVTLIWALAVTR